MISRLRLFAICALGALIGLTTVSALTQAERTWNPRGGPSDEAQIKPETRSMTSSAVQDPRGGPPWAILEYQTTDGRTCAKPGRLVDGEVGALGDRGKLLATGLAEGGDCLDTGQLEQGVSYQVATQFQDPRTQERAPVTFISGLARADVQSIDVETENGSRSAAINGSTYLVILPGVLNDSVKLIAQLDGGGTLTTVVPAVPASVREHRRKAVEAAKRNGARP